jgi:glycosyltransferase involved in cell wall biosynthesis
VTAPKRVLFISGSAASATLRYRVRLPEEALRGRGVSTAAVHFTDRRAAALSERADVVVLYRVPASRELVLLVQRLRERRRPPLITYDVDDLVFRTQYVEHLDFLDSFTPKQREIFVRDVGLREQLIPYADLLTGSTEQILEEMRALSSAPSSLLPNGVGRLGLELADHARAVPRDHGSFRVGYFSGSATHDSDWAAVEDGVVEFLVKHPDAELWLVGKVIPTGALGPVSSQVRIMPPVPWTELPALLRAVDVTLAPLDRTPFTDAKSAIKWLESALVETPTIATPTPPFVAAVEDGTTGVLAEKPEDWGQALERLAADPEERAKLGRAAREAALAAYGPRVQAQRLMDVLSAGPPVGPSTMPVQDMPSGWRLTPVELEAYPFPADVVDVTLELSGRQRVQASTTVAAARVAKLGRRYARGARRRVGRLVSSLRS